MKTSKIVRLLLGIAVSVCGCLRSEATYSDFNWSVPNIKGIQEISMLQGVGATGSPYTTLSYSSLASEAYGYGTKQAAINIPADRLLPAGLNASTGTAYTYNGTTYYLSPSFISYVDGVVLDLTSHDVKVTAIVNLVSYMAGPSDFYYPAAVSSGPYVYGFNMSTSAGVNIFKAVISFLANRYSNEGSPGTYGLISGYVVGNELQDAYHAYNMGLSSLSLSYVAGEYAKAIENAWDVIQGVDSNVRLYICLERAWNSSSVDGVQFSGVDFLNAFDAAIKALPDGNIGWNVAFHPYPLGTPWSDAITDSNITKSFSADRVTFENLEVLYFFLNQPSFQYSGQVRRVILDEQGVADDGSGSSASRAAQAAAYAYCYYRASLIPNVDAFHWYQFVDSSMPTGGATTVYSGLLDASGNEKLSFSNAYRYADNTWATDWTGTYLTAIGASAWSDLNPYVVPTVSGTAAVANFSYRGEVGPGGTMIGGLGVYGGTKQLLIRAVGPGLNATSGLTGYLSDPKITVLSGGSTIATNTGWGGASALSTAATAVGAFALSVGDSAVLVNLPTGSYTLNVDTAGGSNSGIALLEVYDCGTISGTPYLYNFSARNNIGTGNGIGIGSFVISGTGTKSYLVRADGPALAGFGVPNYLPDPQLTMYSASTGAQLAQNIGWSTSMNSYDTSSWASTLGAFSWAANSGDSGLFVRVNPGVYSFQIQSVSGASGKNALFEVYDAGD